jgi:hypothetical protein
MKYLNKPVFTTMAVSQDPKTIKLKIPNAYNFDGSCFYALLAPEKMKEGLYEGLKDCLEFYREFGNYIAYTDRNVNDVRGDATSLAIEYLESLVKTAEERLKIS